MAAKKEKDAALPLLFTVAEATYSDLENALVLYRRLWRQDQSNASILRLHDCLAADKIQELAESSLTRKSASHYNALLRSSWAPEVTALDLIGAFGLDGLKSADFLRGVRGLAESGCDWLQALKILHKKRELRRGGGIRQGVRRRGKEWIAWDGLQALSCYFRRSSSPSVLSPKDSRRRTSIPMAYSPYDPASTLYPGIEWSPTHQHDELGFEWHLQPSAEADSGSLENPLSLESLFDDGHTEPLEYGVHPISHSLSPTRSGPSPSSHPYFLAGHQDMEKPTPPSRPRCERLKFTLGEVHASHGSTSGLTPASNFTFANDSPLVDREVSVSSEPNPLRRNSFRDWGEISIETSKSSQPDLGHFSQAPSQFDKDEGHQRPELNNFKPRAIPEKSKNVNNQLLSGVIDSGNEGNSQERWFSGSSDIETPNTFPLMMRTDVFGESGDSGDGFPSFSSPDVLQESNLQEWLSGATINNIMRLFNPPTGLICIFESRTCSLTDENPSRDRNCRPLRQGTVEQIYFPLNFDNRHWVLGWIHTKTNEYGIYDPLPASPYRTASLKALEAFIDNAGLDNSTWDVSTTEQNLPCQTNDYDCGVLITAVFILFMHGLSTHRIENPVFWRRSFRLCQANDYTAIPLETFFSSKQISLQHEATQALAAQLSMDVPAAQRLMLGTESIDGLEQQLSLCQHLIDYTTALLQDRDALANCVDRALHEDEALAQKKADLMTKVVQCRKIFDLGAHLQQSDSDLHFQGTMTEALSNLEMIKHQLSSISRLATEGNGRAETLRRLQETLNNDGAWCREKLEVLEKQKELLSDKLADAITRLSRLAENRKGRS